METSDNGRELIERFEGLRRIAYQDVGGVWTIGYGHTGPEIFDGMTISSDRADELLEADLAISEASVNSLVTAPLNQNQFDALVSLVFNIGHGNFLKSTLLRSLNNGDNPESVAQEFTRWCHANGQYVEGLCKRREAEKNLFLLPEDY